MTKKIILTDVDGVCLEWMGGFDKWVTARGYKHLPNKDHEYSIAKRYGIPTIVSYDLVREFNTGPDIEFLEPFRDSVEYVTKLHREGYVFHAITSLSDDPVAANLRQKNLDQVFGKGVFQRLICLAMGSAKSHVLEEYRDSGFFWIEDHEDNADDGYRLGLRSVLMEHEHNAHHVCPYPIVENWSEVYSLIKPPRRS